MDKHGSNHSDLTPTNTLRQGPGVRSRIEQLQKWRDKANATASIPTTAPLQASQKQPWNNRNVPKADHRRHTTRSLKRPYSLISHDDGDREVPLASHLGQREEKDRKSYQPNTQSALLCKSRQPEQSAEYLSLSTVQEVAGVRPISAEQPRGMSKRYSHRIKTATQLPTIMAHLKISTVAESPVGNAQIPVGHDSIYPSAISVEASQASFPRPNDLFPDSLNPQMRVNPPTDGVSYTIGPSSDEGEIPKYISAFEYAMRPFVVTHTERNFGIHLSFPSPKHQKKLSNSSSTVSRLPSSCTTSDNSDQALYLSTYAKKPKSVNHKRAKIDRSIVEIGIDFHLIEKDPFKIRLRQIQIRTLLMRCIVLQSTIRELERKPWTQDTLKLLRDHYSKMRVSACKARRLADSLYSRELQARCEYWTGRACGGTRDYQAAVHHFMLAINLDVENDVRSDGTLKLRGLRPAEKSDVRFLLQGVSERCETWEKKSSVTKHMYRGSGVYVGHFQWAERQSPLWRPDRDRILQESNEWEEIEQDTEVSGNHEELEGTKRGEITRIASYVLETPLLSQKIDSAEIKRPRGSLSLVAFSPNPSLPKGVPQNPSLKDLRLSPLLNSTGTTSPLMSRSRSSSASSNLLQRRGKLIAPIETEHIQKCANLGEAANALTSGNTLSSQTPTPSNISGTETEITKSPHYIARLIVKNNHYLTTVCYRIPIIRVTSLVSSIGRA